jgi:hypothetical protein
MLSAKPGESYQVECYRDKVFGTFVFKRPSPIVMFPVGNVLR